MAINPGTNKQLPDHAILDHFGKQVYLGNGFSVPLSFSLSNTSETVGMLITMPAITATSFPANYVSQFIKNSHFECTGNVTVRYYMNPTINTTGTASTPVQLRPANANTSAALVYVNGQFTITDNGTLFDLRAALAGAQATSDLLSVIDPGKSMLITFQTTAASTNPVVGAIQWDEF